MPVVPNGGASPYPTVNSVMDVARARVGDMLDSKEGTLLTNDANYTQTYLSAAWQWYQDKCNNSGIELQIRETVLTGLPMRASEDTSLQCFVSWDGCSDGISEYDSPTLPPDLVNPLSVWKRQSGTQNQFCLMRQAEDGLPTSLDANVYDWRANAMYYYGSTASQDWRIRYSTYWADLDITLPLSLVPMRGSQDCLGARVAFEHASARGAVQAAAMASWADDAFDKTVQRTSRRKQRATFRRKPYSGNTSGYGFLGNY